MLHEIVFILIISKAGVFVSELWTLLVDAQQQSSGIPAAFIAQKKKEIISQRQQTSRFGPAPSQSSESASVVAPSSIHKGSTGNKEALVLRKDRDEDQAIDKDSDGDGKRGNSRDNNRTKDRR